MQINSMFSIQKGYSFESRCIILFARSEIVENAVNKALAVLVCVFFFFLVTDKASSRKFVVESMFWTFSMLHTSLVAYCYSACGGEGSNGH
ncbi:hypothetical protein RchiOBHm_Chr7g0200861 [Rosa chinensis]|uniref:Uncharacterized protein n=1 Tax=Rosa chinensis TaxID=74649 RepID=A0A2P6P7S5_ROSCH|nr:hypothetical protein RchiOBHm_Chr7g0200861 [Rosa chinensis]